MPRPSVPQPGQLQHDVEAARQSLQTGHPQEARLRFRALRRVVARADAATVPAALRVRVLMGLAAAEFEVTGRAAVSTELLAEADHEAARVGSAQLRATIWGQQGMLLLRQGQVARAMDSFDRAIEQFEDVGDYDKLTLLLNRGALHLERGSSIAAEADFRRCLELALTVGERTLAWKAQHNLGYAEFLQGQLPRALESMQTADALNPGDPHPIPLLDRARVLREAGLVGEADALLARASHMQLGARLFQDLAETELVRAECALVQGDARRAKSFAASAAREFARRGNRRWRRRAELFGLRCDAQLAEERGERARRTALLTVALAADRLGLACRAEGRADLVRSSSLVAAECRLRAGEAVQGAWRLRASDPLLTRLHTREVRALAAAGRGDAKVAAREVRRGLGELGAYQHGFGSLDLRTASSAHGVALARLGLEVAMESRSPAAVLALVECARAVSTRLPQVHPPHDDLTADLLSRLRRAEEEARGLEGDASAVEELASLRNHARQLQRQIRARAWELEGRTDRPAEASPRLSQVRQTVRDTGYAFATLARHRDRFVAVVVKPNKSSISDLASVATVNELVRRVRADLDLLAMPWVPEVLQATAQQSLFANLRRLQHLVLDPLSVDGRPLVLSCSGSLTVLPWGLLPGRAGLPTVVTPSGSTWLRAAARRTRPRQPRVTALAGPGLHRAADEATRVSRIWPNSSLAVDTAATVARARSEVASSEVFHLAAHGVHRQDSPLFSSLRMADGPLYAYELDADARPAACVVLSACEAGLATLRPGDEGIGLTTVLLHLGTQSVLAGVARVRDDVAAEVMERVHRRMASGADSALALAEAQAQWAEGPAPAAFVCFGASWW